MISSRIPFTSLSPWLCRKGLSMKSSIPSATVCRYSGICRTSRPVSAASRGTTEARSPERIVRARANTSMMDQVRERRRRWKKSTTGSSR